MPPFIVPLLATSHNWPSFANQYSLCLQLEMAFKVIASEAVQRVIQAVLAFPMYTGDIHVIKLLFVCLFSPVNLSFITKGVSAKKLEG